MVVLYQALALDAYFTKRKKSDFYLLFSLFWSIKKKWSWILSDFKPFLYFIFNKLYFLDKKILFIIFIPSSLFLYPLHYFYTPFIIFIPPSFIQIQYLLYTITTQTIITQLPHKRKYRISIIDTRYFRIQTLVSLYRTENCSRLSRVFWLGAHGIRTHEPRFCRPVQ